MKSLTAAACSLFLITFGADAAAGEGWRADLPWAVLESKLSTSASLIDTGFKDYASECTTEFVNFRYGGVHASPEDDTWSIRSTYALINQVRVLCQKIIGSSFKGSPPLSGPAGRMFPAHKKL